MTNLVGRTTSGRGRRRREQLTDAGVALLADGGWPAVTTRAVADRAGAQVGLIHYHFGGLAGLHAAIARRAGEEVITPVLDALLEAREPHAALDTLRGLVPATTGEGRTLRLAVELMAGALREPALGDVLRDALRQARTRIGERLGELYPSWSEARRTGAATVVAALLDGLLLHQVLDTSLPLDEALATLGDLIAERSRGGSRPVLVSPGRRAAGGRVRRSGRRRRGGAGVVAPARSAVPAMASPVVRGRPRP